jgi:hypothetical protein
MDESQINSGVSEFPSNFFSMISGSSLSDTVRVAGKNLWSRGAESREDVSEGTNEQGLTV